MTEAGIDVSVPPSGTGCAECLRDGGWWAELRRCAACGHIGCCDSSPGTHATAHYRETGHRYMRTFEPGQSWWWDYETESVTAGPELAPPESHPLDQPTPGPAGAVPPDWPEHLHR